MEELTGIIALSSDKDVSGLFRVPVPSSDYSVRQFLNEALSDKSWQGKSAEDAKNALQNCMADTDKDKNKSSIGIKLDGRIERISLDDPVALYVSNQPYGDGRKLDSDLWIMDDLKETESIYDSLEACKSRLVPYVSKMKESVGHLVNAYHDQNSPIRACNDYVADALRIIEEEKERKNEIQEYNNKTVGVVVSSNSEIKERNWNAKVHNDKAEINNEAIEAHNRKVDQDISFRERHPVLALLKETFGDMSYERRELEPMRLKEAYEPLDLIRYFPGHSLKRDSSIKEPLLGYNLSNIVEDDKKYRINILQSWHDTGITSLDPVIKSKLKKIYEHNEKAFEEFEAEVNKSILHCSGKTFDLVVGGDGLSIDVVRHPVFLAEIFTRVLAVNIEHHKRRVKQLEIENEKNLEKHVKINNELKKLNRSSENYYTTSADLIKKEIACRNTDREIDDTKNNAIELHHAYEKAERYWLAVSQMTDNLTEWINSARSMAFAASMNHVFIQGAKDVNTLAKGVESTWLALREISSSYERMLGDEIGIGCYEIPLSRLEKTADSLGVDGSPGEGESITQAKKCIINTKWKEIFMDEETKDNGN